MRELKPLQIKAVEILRDEYGITRTDFLIAMGTHAKDHNLLPSFESSALFLPIAEELEDDGKLHLYLDEEIYRRIYGSGEVND